MRKSPICPICPIFLRGGRWCGEARGLAAVEVGFKQEHLPLLAHASVSTASKNKGIIPEIMIVEVILILEVILPERMITGRDHDHKRGENCVVGLAPRVHDAGVRAAVSAAGRARESTSSRASPREHMNDCRTIAENCADGARKILTTQPQS